MRLLVTGAAGMLGQDTTRAAERAQHTVLALARADLDVTDAGAVERLIGAERPDAVLNCAGYTDVDGAEGDPETAEAVNGEGAGNVARAAARAGAYVLHVSSDYVFDGHKDEPYLEEDPVGPLSAYGRSKLSGERAVAAAGGQWAIVRSSWLYGSGGPNFVATMLRLAGERDTLRVVADQVGCPTWTGHLGGALVDLAELKSEGIHHVAGTGSCSWHEFAVEIFRQAGAVCRVETQTTADLARPAPRPAWSVLASRRPDTPRLPGWQEGLAGYLAERAEQPAAAGGRPA